MSDAILPPPLGVGLVLHPNLEYLAQCDALIHSEVDFFEVSPETCWQTNHATGLPQASPWLARFVDLKNKTRRPIVGHGLCLSPGTADDSDRERRRLAAWVECIRQDNAQLEYLWYTEHLGWATDGAIVPDLPLPLPPTDESVQTVCRRLGMLKSVLPLVGFENQVSYFNFGDARDQPAFWNRMTHEGNLWLLLDLHNAYTECQNAGADLDEYLDAIDLDRVIEMHLSGGSESDPGWLASGATMRLDSHDAPVPEVVWRAYERLRPRCKNLRGVVVERLDGTMSDDDVSPYRDELRRAREIFFKA